MAKASLILLEFLDLAVRSQDTFLVEFLLTNGDKYAVSPAFVVAVEEVDETKTKLTLSNTNNATNVQGAYDDVFDRLKRKFA